MQTECRLNADFPPLFLAETGRSDWQPADLPKGTDYDLPLQGVIFHKPCITAKTTPWNKAQALALPLGNRA